MSYETPERVCCFAPRAEGGLIVAYAESVAFYDLATGAIDTIASIEPGNLGMRLNDGCTDRQGRLILGGMNEATGAADSSVIRIDADGTITSLIEGVFLHGDIRACLRMRKVDATFQECGFETE